MRSRYSAFALGDARYLWDTWHPNTRPAALDLDPDVRWTGLDVLATSGGGLLDTDGIVEFAAHYVRGSGAGGRRTGAQYERTRFRREEGRWNYLDGVSLG